MIHGQFLRHMLSNDWVAVKELTLSYHNGIYSK